jgi:hypothetical protein
MNSLNKLRELLGITNPLRDPDKHPFSGVTRKEIDEFIAYTDREIDKLLEGASHDIIGVLIGPEDIFPSGEAWPDRGPVSMPGKLIPTHIMLVTFSVDRPLVVLAGVPKDASVDARQVLDTWLKANRVVVVNLNSHEVVVDLKRD